MVLLPQQTLLILMSSCLALHSNLDLTSLQIVHLQACRILWSQMKPHRMQSHTAGLHRRPGPLPPENESPCQARVLLMKGLKDVDRQNCVFSLALFLKQAIKDRHFSYASLQYKPKFESICV